MKTGWILLVGLLLTGASCSKKAPPPQTAAEPAPAPSDPAAAASPEAPANVPPAARPAPRTAEAKTKTPSANPQATVFNQEIVGDVDPFMTSQLRIFISQKGRMPTSFTEFASARMDSIPVPAKGRRYVIDAATQTVKLVKN